MRYQALPIAMIEMIFPVVIATVKGYGTSSMSAASSLDSTSELISQPSTRLSR